MAPVTRHQARKSQDNAQIAPPTTPKRRPRRPSNAQPASAANNNGSIRRRRSGHERKRSSHWVTDDRAYRPTAASPPDHRTMALRSDAPQPAALNPAPTRATASANPVASSQPANSRGSLLDRNGGVAGPGPGFSSDQGHRQHNGNTGQFVANQAYSNNLGGAGSGQQYMGGHQQSNMQQQAAYRQQLHGHQGTSHQQFVYRDPAGVGLGIRAGNNHNSAPSMPNHFHAATPIYRQNVRYGVPAQATYAIQRQQYTIDGSGRVVYATSVLPTAGIIQQQQHASQAFNGGPGRPIFDNPQQRTQPPPMPHGVATRPGNNSGYQQPYPNQLRQTVASHTVNVITQQQLFPRQAQHGLASSGNSYISGLAANYPSYRPVNAATAASAPHGNMTDNRDSALSPSRIDMNVLSLQAANDRDRNGMGYSTNAQCGMNMGNIGNTHSMGNQGQMGHRGNYQGGGSGQYRGSGC